MEQASESNGARKRMLPQQEESDSEHKRMRTMPDIAGKKEDHEQIVSNQSLGLIRPYIATFTEAEVDVFLRLSEFANPNPRKIKRITNLYILARLLAPPDPSLRDKIAAWIFLCEQWPVRMSWILQVLEDNGHNVKLENNPLATHQQMTLHDFYLKYVESIIFKSSDVTGNKHNVAYTLDGDPQLFQKMLRKVDLLLCDIGSLRMGCDRSKLLSYTLNLSPAVRFLVSRIASLRVEVTKLEEVQHTSFTGISILWQSASSMKETETDSYEPSFNMDRQIERNTRADKAKEEDELEQAAKTFRDDKSGTDHISYSEYAMVLSQLIVYFIEVPCTFGLFGMWGTGKSFTMNKIQSHIAACAISQLIWSHGKDSLHRDLLEEIGQLAKDDDKIMMIYTWLVCGCDTLAIKEDGHRLSDLKAAVVNDIRSERKKKPDLVLDVFGQTATVFTQVLSIIAYIIENVVRFYRKSNGNMRLELLRTVWQKQSGVEYEFVWFNAWLFCGSENLWAGLVLKLHEAVEAHYGPAYAQAEHTASIIACTLKLLFAVILLIVGLALSRWTDPKIVETVRQTFSLDFNFARQSTVLLKRLTGITFSGASVGVAGQQLLKLFNPPATPSQKISKRVSKANFKSKLGFMDEIKEEIDTIAGFLNKPETVPTFWDKLVPKNWKISRKIITFIKRFLPSPGKSRRPCRLVIFVDDLDRCPPEKIVEVLQALVLLSENTPFITFLAVDPRVLVSAVESVNTGFYEQTGIGGHEYIDKIVQVPFAFPPLSDMEKGQLFRGYLTGEGQSDHVEFTDRDNDMCRYELLPDKSGMRIKVNRGHKFEGPVTSFKYAGGTIYDSIGTAPLPYISADSILRQIKDLAKRADPPIPVEGF